MLADVGWHVMELSMTSCVASLVIWSERRETGPITYYSSESIHCSSSLDNIHRAWVWWNIFIFIWIECLICTNIISQDIFTSSTPHDFSFFRPYRHLKSNSANTMYSAWPIPMLEASSRLFFHSLCCNCLGILIFILENFLQAIFRKNSSKLCKLCLEKACENSLRMKIKILRELQHRKL